MDQLASRDRRPRHQRRQQRQKLEDAFDQIQDELRTQYLLSYTPTNLNADGTFRKIELELRQGSEGPGPQRLLRSPRE